MCGIHGGWLTEGIDRSAINASLNAIVHRGPDDSGTYEARPAFLGMRRLSIIDLAGGHQPIFNEDGRIAVVFNGEIYNYRELIPELQAKGHVFQTKSDTEVLVHLYEEHGTDMCRHLRGMFAFAIWDGREQCLFIGRDRFGKKPLYYARTRSGGLLLASELKALVPLMKAAGETLSVRQQGIYDYLSLSYLPQPATIYDEVSCVPAGAWMRFDGQGLKIEPYWRMNYEPKSSISYEEAKSRTRELIAEAVRLRLRSDVPLGVFLSGGVDSSVIAYEAARALGESLQTFTVAVVDEALDESAVARRTASALGVQNTVLNMQVSPLDSLQRLVRQYDQPYADSSAIPSMEISRLAREHVKVVLNGDGGDELFAGYRRYVAAEWGDRFRWMPASLAGMSAGVLEAAARRRRSALGFGARFMRGLAMAPGARYLAWTSDMLTERDKQRVWIGEPMRPTETWIEFVLPTGLSSLDTQLCGDAKLILPSDLLVKMDIATSSASLEGRSPLMDHVVAEFTAGLPNAYRVSGGRPKAILRDAYKGLLPEEVIVGAKKGFEIPMASWLKQELRPVLMDTVGSRSAHVRNFLDGDFVDDILGARTFQDRNWAGTCYALMVLELWLREASAWSKAC
jgi:asparagine synthase (glutamine-hydrolysing)